MWRIVGPSDVDVLRPTPRLIDWKLECAMSGQDMTKQHGIGRRPQSASMPTQGRVNLDMRVIVWYPCHNHGDPRMGEGLEAAIHDRPSWGGKSANEGFKATLTYQRFIHDGDPCRLCNAPGMCSLWTKLVCGKRQLNPSRT